MRARIWLGAAIMGVVPAFVVRFRNRLTYANVVATLALFIALGGASYAAISLPAGSVGPRQLRAGAVTLGKLGFPLASATANATSVTIPGFQCQGIPGQPAPPCPAPVPVTIASTTIDLSRPAKVLILATSELSAQSTSSTASTQVQLYGRADQGQLTSVTSVNVASPGGQETGVYQAVTDALRAGRHTLEVFATDSGPNVIADSTTLAALALPSP